VIFVRYIPWFVWPAIIVLIFAVWIISRQAVELQGELYSRLENKFGFHSEVIDVASGDDRIDVLAVYPDMTGLLHQAGFRDGDIVLSHSQVEFYGLLYKKKGSVQTIEIVSDSGLESIDEGVRKTILFKIPDKEKK
jgi:hypothetical protein